MEDTAARPTLDSHLHVWDANCALVPDRRHTPVGEARVDQLLGVLEPNGIARAVLVQPSFLGTDNSYLLGALAARPEVFRAIAVVDALTSPDALRKMQAMGVIGLRYNLLGLSPRLIETAPMRALTARAASLGLWIEVHATGPDWQTILPLVEDAPLMIDHFGRPTGANCPGLALLLERDPARTCVKFSAPYRQTMTDMAPVARAFLDRFGPERCLWASDWPWTEHTGRHSYGDCIDWLADWATLPERQRMREAAPFLTGFETPT